MLKNWCLIFFTNTKPVVHYENLKLYMKLGLKLKKIHRVLELHHTQWLKIYVKFKKRKNRIEAKKTSGKDGKELCTLYKVMSNIMYDKTM